MSDFRDFLNAAAARFENKQSFARAIGITPGRFSRILRGDHSLDVQNCLKLAKLTGESASHVLRLAGKGEIADLLESLYGHARPALTPSQRELLDTWETLTPRARESLRNILGDLTRRQPKRRTA